MVIRLSFASLSDGRWYEDLTRFFLGGLATVMTGAIAAIWGPATGGLFLAFPTMLCASVTLIETHERRRKSECGLKGRNRARDAAALDAAGAALGSFGLGGFALTMSILALAGIWTGLGLALMVWAVISTCLWWTHKRVWRSWTWPWARFDQG
jgi:hypothetical protein